ncbi:unnamed protein product, partial [Rotaria socialis]
VETGALLYLPLSILDTRLMYVKIDQVLPPAVKAPHEPPRKVSETSLPLGT